MEETPKAKEVKKATAFDKKDIEDGKLMAILSYLGILALIPYFAEKNNKYVKAHAKTGMNLFLLELIVCGGIYILSTVCALTIILIFVSIILSFVSWVVGIFFIVISIMGIINAANGEHKPLPIVGGIKFIK